MPSVTLPIETLLAYRSKLVHAMMSGASVIEFEDRRIERRSIDELMAALAWVDGEIGAITGISARAFPRVRTVSTCKDL